MAEFKIQVDTGSGLSTVAHSPGFRFTEQSARPATLQFTIRTRTSGHPYRVDQDVALLNDAGSTTFFEGTIVGRKVKSIGDGGLRDITITAKASDQILDSGRVRITRRFTDTPAGTIITSINTTELGSTFTATGVVSGPTLSEMVFDGDTVREAFARIEEACVGYALYISASGAITFDLEENLSDAAQDVVPGAYGYDPTQMTIDRGEGTFYNRVVVIGPEQKGEEIKELLVQAPNTNEYWLAKHKISTFESDGTNKVTDTTNTVSYNAKGRGAGADETVGAYDFDWEAGSPTLRRIATMTSGNIDLQVEYVPRVPLIFAVQDTTDIESRGGYPSGVYEARVVLDRLMPMKEAVAMGLGFLADHSQREFIQITYKASTATVSRVTPGQRQTITIPEEGITGAFTIEKVVSIGGEGERFDMLITATQGKRRTSSRSLGEALRTQSQAGSGADSIDGPGRDALLYAAAWRDDIEATCTCTLADV